MRLPRFSPRPSASTSLAQRFLSRFFPLALLCALLVPTGAARAVEFSTEDGSGKKFTVCRVDVRKEKLELFLHDGTGQPFRRFEKLAADLGTKGRRVVFAMNAGMFQPGFAPVGLFLSGGRETSPLNTGDGDGNFFLKPNGVFALFPGKAAVAETSRWPSLSDGALLATQSGPILVTGGKIHPAFNPSSKNRHFRNAVGVPASGDAAVFAISEEPVTFHEFALLFRDTLKCPDALYLDGVVSGLYAPALSRHDRRADLGPMLAVTE